MTHDAAGNVLADGQRTFTYDGLNMTTSATVGTNTYRYLYDANDERVAAFEILPAGNRTTWTLRGFRHELLRVWTQEPGSTLTWKEDEIWRGTSLLGLATPQGRRHYALDHLGSPRAVLDDNGDLLALHNFEPFGNGGMTGTGALQFTGHERDRASLGGGVVDLPDYAHARNLDTGGGRFLSVDPVIEIDKASREPQRWNRYSYALNNPVRYTDPTGKVVFGAAGVADEIKDRKLERQQAQLATYARQLAKEVRRGGIDSKLAINLYWNKAVSLTTPTTAKGAKPTGDALVKGKENALLIATGAALDMNTVRGSRNNVGDAITRGSLGADTLHHFFINAINTFDGMPVRAQQFGANDVRGETDARDIRANNAGAMFGDLLQRDLNVQPSSAID